MAAVHRDYPLYLIIHAPYHIINVSTCSFHLLFNYWPRQMNPEMWPRLLLIQICDYNYLLQIKWQRFSNIPKQFILIQIISLSGFEPLELIFPDLALCYPIIFR